MNNNYTDVSSNETLNMEASTYYNEDFDTYYDDCDLNFFGVSSNLTYSNLTYSNLEFKSYEN